MNASPREALLEAPSHVFPNMPIDVIHELVDVGHPTVSFWQVRRKSSPALLRAIGAGAACILSSMTLADILSSIDSEIARLMQARALLSGSSTEAASPSRKRRKKLSVAARRKIADAQRKRWAKQKSAK